MTYLQLALGFVLNLAVALLIVRGLYDPAHRRQEYMLLYLTLNTSLFLLFALLSGIEVSVGLGLSLFAIFRVLRYRTDPIPMREMAYLFVLMSLPVINAVLLNQGNYAALLIGDGLMVAALYVGEQAWGCRYDRRRSITLEKIDLIKPQNYDRLLADLRERTGLRITRCEIGHVDFLRDVAEVQVYYQEDPARWPQRLSLASLQQRFRLRSPSSGSYVNGQVTDDWEGSLN